MSETQSTRKPSWDQSFEANHEWCWEDSHGQLWFDNGEPCYFPRFH